MNHQHHHKLKITSKPGFTILSFLKLIQTKVYGYLFNLWHFHRFFFTMFGCHYSKLIFGTIDFLNGFPLVILHSTKNPFKFALFASILLLRLNLLRRKKYLLKPILRPIFVFIKSMRDLLNKWIYFKCPKIARNNNVHTVLILFY